ARETLDREVLVDGTDDRAIWFGHDRIVGRVRNSATGRDCREPRSPPGTNAVVDLIVMEKRSTPGPTLTDTVRKHAHDGVEILPFKIAIWIGASYGEKQIFFEPFLSRRRGDNLLSENVERRRRNEDRVQTAISNGLDQRRAFDQFVTRGCEE